MSALSCPLATPTILLEFLLPWAWGISLSCSSKAQLLLLTLDEGYLLTAAFPDLQRGMALGPSAPRQPPLLGHHVVPPGHRPWHRAWCCSSRPPPLASGEVWLLSGTATVLGHGIAPLGCRLWPRMRGSSSLPPPLTSDWR